MRNLTIGTLLVHDINQNLNFWLENPIEGLESPEYRINAYERPGEDGGVVSNEFYGTRVVTLRGKVTGSSAAQLETNRQALATACAIQKDDNGYPTPVTVSFTTQTGNQYFCYAYFNKPVFAYDQITFSNFLLQMTVPSPFIFGATQVQSGAIMRASGGGFILPVILPITSTGQTGGVATLVNSGNATSYPLITLTGPLTSPFIQNNKANKSMQINYTLGTGDVVVIDMLQKTIIINGSTSLLSTKDANSDWWGILPGTNSLSFSTSSTADTGNMQVTFYSAWLGV